MKNLIFYLSLGIVFIFCGVMFSLSGLFGEIKPESVNRETLARLIQLRDFQTLPHNTVLRLLERCEKEFGPNGVRKPDFTFPAIEKRLIQYFQNHRNEKPSVSERNLNTLAKEQFVLWMIQYESATHSERAVLMKNIVAEMKYWQAVYFDFLASMNLPEPTLLQLMEELKKMFDFFKENETEERIKQIDAFSKILQQHLVADGIHDAVKQIFPSFLKKK